MSGPRLIAPLQDLCMQVVRSSFTERPTFGKLPEQLVQRVIDGLALDLPLELAGSVRATPFTRGVASYPLSYWLCCCTHVVHRQLPPAPLALALSVSGLFASGLTPPANWHWKECTRCC